MAVGPSWNELWLGMNQNGYWPLLGRLDDVRLYDRALSASEVQQLYELEGPPLAGVERVIHLHQANLKVGADYQLQTSPDLANWTNLGGPFTATSTETNSFHEVTDTNTLWRLAPSPGDPVSHPRTSLIRAVRLLFAHLSVGASYQLQFSSDLSTWIDHGPVFTATNTAQIYPEYVDFDRWGSPFFQLNQSP